VIAEAGFREKLGGKSVVLGCLGGMLPDLDIVTGVILADPWVHLTVHRGISHSLFLVPFLSGVLAWIFWRWEKRETSFWWWYLLAFLVLFTHPLLDCCTSYGTQIFAPFSDKRIAWNCVSIVDIFYSLPLLLTLVCCPLVKKWWPQKNTWWIGMGALLLTTSYLVYGGLNHDLALNRTLADADSKDATIHRAEVYPQLTTVWVWRTVVKTPDGFLLGRTNTLLGENVTSIFLENDRDPLIEKARRLEKIKVYRWFADDLLREKITRYTQGNGMIQFFDMRYGNPMETDHYLWGARVYFDRDGNLGRVERFYNRSFSMGELIGRVVKGITTP
jgi:inner membrane protein